MLECGIAGFGPILWCWILNDGCVLGTKEHWNILLAITAVPALVSASLWHFLPESPRYLFVLQHNGAEGVKGTSTNIRFDIYFILLFIIYLSSVIIHHISSFFDWFIIILIIYYYFIIIYYLFIIHCDCNNYFIIIELFIPCIIHTYWSFSGNLIQFPTINNRRNRTVSAASEVGQGSGRRDRTAASGDHRNGQTGQHGWEHRLEHRNHLGRKKSPHAFHLRPPPARMQPAVGDQRCKSNDKALVTA